MNQPPPINPHAWRKFCQAQDNTRVAWGMTIESDGTWRYTGQRPRKSTRRTKKWGKQMRKWIERLFP